MPISIDLMQINAYLMQIGTDLMQISPDLMQISPDLMWISPDLMQICSDLIDKYKISHFSVLFIFLILSYLIRVTFLYCKSKHFMFLILSYLIKITPFLILSYLNHIINRGIIYLILFWIKFPLSRFFKSYLIFLRSQIDLLHLL